MPSRFALTCFGCLFLAVQSINPGAFAVLIVTLLLLVFVAFSAIALFKQAKTSVAKPEDDSRVLAKSSPHLCTLIVLVTFALIVTAIPMRAAVWCSQKSLSNLAESAVVGHPGGYTSETPNHKAGLFRFYDIVKDERGGTYFRTSFAGTLGPDIDSHGLCHAPNGQGTPFGDAGYVQQNLFGQWYVFSTNDDW